jgi:antitoxin ParD1/3/4
MNVSLTPELEEFVRSRVESGLYNSASEVIRDALRTAVRSDAEKKGISVSDLLSQSMDAVRRGEVIPLADVRLTDFMESAQRRLATGETVPEYISGESDQ